MGKSEMGLIRNGLNTEWTDGCCGVTSFIRRSGRASHNGVKCNVEVEQGKGTRAETNEQSNIGAQGSRFGQRTYEHSPYTPTVLVASFALGVGLGARKDPPGT